MASVTLARPRRSRNPIVVEDRRAGWVFILPAVILFATFLFGPVLFAFFISLHKWELVRPEREFIGFDNYRAIFNDDNFWIAFRNTTWYAAGVVPAQTITGLVLAVLANRKIRGKTFFRTAFYFPSISSSVVISIIFIWMYSNHGLVNYLLELFGFPTPRPPWLSNPKGVIAQGLNAIGIEDVSVWLAGPSVALLAIMMLNVWTTTGTMMVIFLAGLQDIPGDAYEAAALDGASRWRMFRDITVPLLKPVTAFVVTIGLIGTFQVFDQIWVMSAGGPQKTTTTLAYLIYTEAFQFGNGFGYASAIAVILFMIILALYFVQRRITGESAER
jgi:multiple sugar transport system permease protein